MNARRSRGSERRGGGIALSFSCTALTGGRERLKTDSDSKLAIWRRGKQELQTNLTYR
ncbi:hypothetical protein LP7551_00187 [Roseibium album]|nr:hypothetical protein LP7551_00187 [Roseibium album]